MSSYARMPHAEATVRRRMARARWIGRVGVLLNQRSGARSARRAPRGVQRWWWLACSRTGSYHHGSDIGIAEVSYVGGAGHSVRDSNLDSAAMHLDGSPLTAMIVQAAQCEGCVIQNWETV